ncbi:MAG: hypothetical protein K2H74_00635 [Paramuribaculum sp.]|nr:hypothetical protein [Paramuribaculum sp.]
MEGKQTLSQLAEKYGVNKSTVWRRLKTMRHIRVIPKEKDVVINIDTTYWGRSLGLMVIKDAFRNKIIWYKFIHHETISDYKEGIEWLRANDFRIYGIVCDGLRGLFQELRVYRVQMCQFHQAMIVRRYLTNRPDLPAAQELLQITKMLAHTDKESFIGMLEQWHQRWYSFLKERSVDRKSGRSTYTHKRIRSAYLSLMRNMPWLWTFYDYPDLHIPNTNNALEGIFTDIKTKLRVHSGISKERRINLIKEYIARRY